MYQAFYGLKQRPFSIQPDPEFLYFGRRHELAYAVLEYGVQDGAAFCVISGEIGCGKTTLLRYLISRLGPEFTVGLLSNTYRSVREPLEWILFAFGRPYQTRSRVGLFAEFQGFLRSEYAAGRRVLLIVDEAQNLSPSALEALRMLSNINADKDRLLQTVLVGQPQLQELLRRPELRQLAQRVSADFYLPPLERAEVGHYVRHRLRVAGREAPLFTLKACERIAEASGGIPRRVNVLCETALVYGYSTENEWIDDELIEEVLADRQRFGVVEGAAALAGGA